MKVSAQEDVRIDDDGRSAYVPRVARETTRSCRLSNARFRSRIKRRPSCKAENRQHGAYKPARNIHTWLGDKRVAFQKIEVVVQRGSHAAMRMLVVAKIFNGYSMRYALPRISLEPRILFLKESKSDYALLNTLVA